MTNRIALILVLGVLLAALGCEDSGPVGPPLPPLPPPITSPLPQAKGEVEVDVIDAFALVSGQGNLLLMELRMEEKGGLGVKLNFIRVEVFRATGEFEERREIGSDDIVEQSGTNRLEANASRQDQWGLLFNATVKKGRTLAVTVGYTDDRGNDASKVLRFVFR